LEKVFELAFSEHALDDAEDVLFVFLLELVNELQL
jgi:hypothetical protein